MDNFYLHYARNTEYQGLVGSTAAYYSDYVLKITKVH
jgi:hypothetical protein